MTRIKEIMCLFALLLIISCSKGLESAAKEQMEKTMKELAKDPSSIQISNVETKFNNDSICIIHFKLSGKNGFGGVSSSNIEYVYMIKSKDGVKSKWETIKKLDEEESILSQARKDYEEKKWETDTNKNLSDDDKKAWYIFFTAEFNMMFSGRKVGAKDDDVKNW